jgi:hypothetical protein
MERRAFGGEPLRVEQSKDQLLGSVSVLTLIEYALKYMNIIESHVKFQTFMNEFYSTKFETTLDQKGTQSETIIIS